MTMMTLLRTRAEVFIQGQLRRKIITEGNPMINVTGAERKGIMLETVDPRKVRSK